jgi:hypothetical protein
MTADMEFANDLLAGLRGKVHPPSGGSVTAGFDWPGLHARLAAGHAARAELARGESPPAAASGSFAAWQTASVSSGKSLPGVNRTDSADGKAPAGIDGEVAGIAIACGRGTE